MEFHVPDDFVPVFGSGTVARGEEYARQGRVLSFKATSGMYRAQVRGSRVYSVELDGGWLNGETAEPEGECTCPIGFNCKHVVAAYLSVLRSIESRPPSVDRRYVEEWLAELRTPRSAARPKQTKAVVYLLQLAPKGHAVELALARPRKKGGYGSMRELGFFDLGELDVAERELAAGLAFFGGSGFAEVSPEFPGAYFDRLLQTGRFLIERDDGHTPLRRGTARPCEFAWVSDPLGARLRITVGGAVLPILPTTPPWYVDSSAALMGPLETPVAARHLQALLRTPPLDDTHAVAARAVFHAEQIEIPPPPTKRRNDVVAPRPQLVFRQGKTRRHESFSDDMGVRARLTFAYRDRVLERHDTATTLSFTDGDETVLVCRDRAREDAYAEQMRGLGLYEDYHYAAGHVVSDWVAQWGPGSPALRRHLASDFPALVSAGWEIDLGDLPVAVHSFDGDIDASVTEDNDWFSVELAADIDGAKVSLVQPLLIALRRQELSLYELTAGSVGDVLLELEEGAFLRIPGARLRPLLGVLLELHQRKPGEALTLSRFQAMLLELPERAAVRAAEARRLRSLAGTLRDHASLVPASEPPGFSGSLRPYQREGLAWLQYLHDHRLGGLLADDMGLGKTVQVLALLAARRGELPNLVVAPFSVLSNWAREAERFAPELKVRVFHGPKRAQTVGDLAGYDIVITTYATLRQDAAIFGAQPFHVVCLDEAQNIKNAATKSHEVARSLKAELRLCLTGTPIENHLEELWAQFEFLLPGALGSRQAFKEQFGRPIEKDNDRERLDMLRLRLAPFILRRTKEVVAPELPPKTETARYIELHGAQRELYEAVRLSMDSRVRAALKEQGLQRSAIVVLDALLKLRQACCDPRLVKIDAARKVGHSAKLDALHELLQALLAEGRRVLVFSQFVEMLELIAHSLAANQVPHLMLTGKTRDREALIDGFNRGEASVFLLSLKAGGTGLNLQAADAVIHYDPWWNPAVERQATDRAHRIGQTKPVFVYKLIAQGTLEERMLALQERKAALADSILAGGASLAALREEELLELFAPLDADG